MPVVDGIEDFQGESWHTGLWPHRPVTFANKRVAVIGTGASAVQMITEIAKTVGHLTVFQRTPNWCTPLRNSTISAPEMERSRELRRDLRALPRYLRLLHPRGRSAQRARRADAEREAFYEKLYQLPGSRSGRGTSATSSPIAPRTTRSRSS